MSEGDKALFWIPEKLAYRGADGAPRGMLVYEVELLKIAP
jgi:FKBP-type peptidyl-prolyl cis-trans isomerase